jgi:hypothetical protein
MLREIKPTLVQKLILSYAIIVLCLVAALLYSVTGMRSIARTAHEIASVDLAAAEAVNSLRDALIAQQRTVGKFSIIPGQEDKKRYSDQKADFKNSLKTLEKSGLSGLSDLKRDYDGYDKVVLMIFEGISVPDEKMRSVLNRVEKDITTVHSQQISHLELKLAAARAKETKTVSRAMLLACSGVVIAISVAAFLVYSFSTSMVKLKKGYPSYCRRGF